MRISDWSSDVCSSDLGRKVAIFVHGCFWHCHTGCRFAKLPSTNTEFWRRKLVGNVQRDCRVAGDLQSAGWRVLNVWECATRDKKFAAYIDRKSTRLNSSH